MTTSSEATEIPSATDVKVTSAALVVELKDGRVVSVPLAWYPRLAEGTPSERRHWELIGPGIGIHWPALDKTFRSTPCCAASARMKARRRCICGGYPGSNRLTRRSRRRAALGRRSRGPGRHTDEPKAAEQTQGNLSRSASSRPPGHGLSQGANCSRTNATARLWS